MSQESIKLTEEESLKLRNAVYHGEQPVCYHQHTLNPDKIKSLDDCIKILSFLCQLTIKPLPEGTDYARFSAVKEYFD